MKVKFWGARGSIPTPISPAIIENKVRRALHGAKGVDLSTDEVLNGISQTFYFLPLASFPVTGLLSTVHMRTLTLLS